MEKELRYVQQRHLCRAVRDRERLEPAQWLGAAVVVGAVATITYLGVRAGRDGGAAVAQPSSASASAQIATTPRPASRS